MDKTCKCCGEAKSADAFSAKKAICKPCRSSQQVAYSKALWANDFFISEIYDLAAVRTRVTGIEWQVDHIVPLQSKIVCGLHVNNNLQVIPKIVNMKKGNRSWEGMP